MILLWHFRKYVIVGWVMRTAVWTSQPASSRAVELCIGCARRILAGQITTTAAKRLVADQIRQDHGKRHWTMVLKSRVANMMPPEKD